MKSIILPFVIQVLIQPGATVKDAIAESLAYSRKHSIRVKFTVNDVTVTVSPRSNARLIRRDWLRASDGCIDKDVGPRPKRVLSKKERMSDARTRAKLRQIRP